MASAIDNSRLHYAPHPHYSPTLRRRLDIEDYRFARYRRLTQVAEIRRQRAYFPETSTPFGHYTSRLRHEQRELLRLRDLCRLAREDAEMEQALRHEPSPSALSLEDDTAASFSEVA
jgi:hypothetical protein